MPAQIDPSPPFDAPEQVVQRQLDAYNAKNLDAWLATYAPDARQHALDGGLLAQGHAAIRERATSRFLEPLLHARLLSRAVYGPVVIDHEIVTRNFAEGPGQMEMLCIYVVESGLIQSATFRFGEPTLT